MIEANYLFFSPKDGRVLANRKEIDPKTIKFTLSIPQGGKADNFVWHKTKEGLVRTVQAVDQVCIATSDFLITLPMASYSRDSFLEAFRASSKSVVPVHSFANGHHYLGIVNPAKADALYPGHLSARPTPTMFFSGANGESSICSTPASTKWSVGLPLRSEDVSVYSTYLPACPSGSHI